MGKFFDNFKRIGKRIDEKANDISRGRIDRGQRFNDGRVHSKPREQMGAGIYDGIDGDNKNSKIDPMMDEFGDYGNNDGLNDGLFNDYNKYDIGIQPSQKPESFHHFILENQYKDLERSIRGFKDVYNKETQKWETKRKDGHCFTDEEAEEILRTAQSHLATDIKLSFINKDVFGQMMMAIFKRLDELFYSISEYRYGRYGEPEVQYNMKLQNRKIFLELWTRVQANYSRAIQGQENKATHGSVQGQESLQGNGNGGGIYDRGRRYG